MIEWFHTLAARIRGAFSPARADREFQQELDSHLDMLTDENIRRGLPPEEARRQARLRLGGAAQLRESHHDAWTFPALDTFAQDIRYALRMLRKSPGFTAVAVLTLALGIGANTAIFSLLNAIALRSLPVPNPQQLVLFEWSARKEPHANQFARYSSCPVDAPGSLSVGTAGCSVSYPLFDRLRSARDVFSGAFCFTHAMVALKINDRLDHVGGMYVSGDFFSTLSPRVAMGRLLEPSDDLRGASPVVVLSYRYWQNRLGADPNVIGKTALINRQPFRIVGVAASNFPKLDPGLPEDVWLTLASQQVVISRATGQTDPGAFIFEVVARLKPGVSSSRAEAAANAIFVPFVTSGPQPLFHAEDSPRAMLTTASRGLASLRWMYSRPLFVLMTAVSLILLLACANVAGLMLVRSAARQQEMAVRNALGAGRGRIIRQLLTESLLLSAAGGALGILLAELAAKSLVASLSANSFFPIQIDAGIDSHVLAFTLAVSTIVGVLFGLSPALRSSRVDLTPALKLSSTAAGASPRHSLRLGNALVVAQVVISMLVLVGAGLLGRTLINLKTVDVGFPTGNLLLCEVDMRASGIKGFDDPRFDRANRELQDRFAALPGVISASYSMMAPLSGGAADFAFDIPGNSSTSHLMADQGAVGPGFFETMRIPLLAGRTFTRADFESPADPAPIVVNQAFARKFLGDPDPIGRVISELPKASRLQVIGVVADARYESVRMSVQPMVFQPDKFGSPTFELRTQGEPKALISMVRDAVARVNSDFLVVEMMTQTEQIDNTIYQERLVATLSILFGVLALALSCIGLYGLVAYSVTRRTREIGIRMALGAQPQQILRLTAMQGVLLTLVGVVIGVAVAAGLTRYLASFLFGVHPTDPWTFAAIAILFAILALIACLIPARRAMRVDPIVALRHE